MISYKAVATLLFITLNIQRAASTAPNDAPGSNPPDKSTLVRKRGPAPIPSGVSKYTNNKMDPVEVQERTTEQTSTSQEKPVPQVNKEFEELIEQEKYNKIFEIGRKMEPEKFWKQLCQVAKTPEQRKGVTGNVTKGLEKSLHLYGDIWIIRSIIFVADSIETPANYLDSTLMMPILLAFKEDCHDRVLDLLEIQKEITASRDEYLKQRGKMTDFEGFVSKLFQNLAPEKDDMALRRFLILRGAELREKHPEIFDVLCQELMHYLSSRLTEPKVEKFLVDLIAQPFILTPVPFVKGLLGYDNHDEVSSAVGKCGWREVIEEGLKEKYERGGEKLWSVIKEDHPERAMGDYPPTADELTAALRYFPKKEELEKELVKKYAPDFLEGVERVVTTIFPTVLVPIVLEYARPTLFDVWSIKSY